MGEWNGGRIATILGVVAAFIAGICVVFLLRAALVPATPTQSVSIYQDWRLTCPASLNGAQICSMTQEVVQAETGRVLVRLAIGQGAPAEGSLVVVVPLNVLIATKMGFSVGENATSTQVDYETCDQLGCMAFVPLTDELRAALGANQAGKVTFAGLDNMPVSPPFSLRGFAEASAALRAENARRTSWWGFLVRG